mmetsp:Transcript_20790/g.25428  ORF Transcript_20790/g.25428 Transcript_20790/m.25428 type:complete len:284 (+) Transcript_20790:522-1373(+)
MDYLSLMIASYSTHFLKVVDLFLHHIQTPFLLAKDRRRVHNHLRLFPDFLVQFLVSCLRFHGLAQQLVHVHEADDALALADLGDSAHRRHRVHLERAELQVRVRVVLSSGYPLGLLIHLVAAARHLNVDLLFDLGLLRGGHLNWVLRLLELLAQGLVQGALLVNLLVPLVPLDLIHSVLLPADQAHLEEHAREEWVHCRRLSRRKEDQLVLARVATAGRLGFKSELEDAELGDKFVENHHTIELDAAKLRTHHPVEHLVEIDEPVVHLDAHLEDDAVHVHLSG